MIPFKVEVEGREDGGLLLRVDGKVISERLFRTVVTEKDTIVAGSVIQYFNEKKGCHYRVANKKYVNLIARLLKDGFSEDDCKKVVDVKCEEWLGNEEMEKFLRPETIFGSKFETYLNQRVGKKKGEQSCPKCHHIIYEGDEVCGFCGEVL